MQWWKKVNNFKILKFLVTRHNTVHDWRRSCREAEQSNKREAALATCGKGGCTPTWLTHIWQTLSSLLEVPCEEHHDWRTFDFEAATLQRDLFLRGQHLLRWLAMWIATQSCKKQTMLSDDIVFLFFSYANQIIIIIKIKLH